MLLLSPAAREHNGQGREVGKGHEVQVQGIEGEVEGQLTIDRYTRRSS